MNIIGIDLSLRSTGICCISDDRVRFKLIKTPATLNNEKLLWYIWNEIDSFILNFKDPIIGLEGLSFNSVSRAKDLIYGNFWMQRTMLYTIFKNVQIVTVKEWRNPLFTKEENKLLAESKKNLKLAQDNIKDFNRSEKLQWNKDNYDLFLKSDIKYLTYAKLPVDIMEQINKITFDKGIYDLTDAYFIAKHIERNLK